MKKLQNNLSQLTQLFEEAVDLPDISEGIAWLGAA